MAAKYSSAFKKALSAEVERLRAIADKADISEARYAEIRDNADDLRYALEGLNDENLYGV